MIDGRKKACCVCNSSPRASLARILDETSQAASKTSWGLFYAIGAGKTLLIFGANVSNAFAEAPPPKQGFYIFPDKAFIEWWTMHKKFPPLPPGAFIPVLSVMQVLDMCLPLSHHDVVMA